MTNMTKNGSGSFCIPKRAIDLLSNPELDTKAIGAYLVIAMCTAEDGVSSSAGIQALENYLKCGKTSAERYVTQLINAGVIADLRLGLGDAKAQRAAVRFKLHDFDEAIEVRAWFDRSIVEFVNRKTNESNILKLCNERPECIRMLLWLYAHLPVGATTVQHPLPPLSQEGIFVRYEWDEDQERESKTHTFQVAAYPRLSLEGCDLVLNYDHLKLERAVDTLLRKGFLYEVIMVWDKPLVRYPNYTTDEPYIDVGSLPLYQLHVRKYGGKLSDDEVGVSHLTLKAATCADIEVFDHEGVVENKFVVISQVGTPVGVAGVYRLSHRVKNAKNLGVKEAWAALMDTEHEYRQWLMHLLEDEYHLDVTGLNQSIQFEAKKEKVAARPSPSLGMRA
ncbi:hypothetical protein [Polaromonas sp. CG_9.11]|uniref:hypothetical protein n=1 Tax=Polaromonas sp. CG_9.11 TaxID=2787730 RepID=UPI0018CBBF08|nr:hypothetical protein [Polaromonas sp. CG_9.11]MBG6075371.1 hypothetical protein [Polaromonas sp. CG_9.11]